MNYRTCRISPAIEAMLRDNNNAPAVTRFPRIPDGNDASNRKRYAQYGETEPNQTTFVRTDVSRRVVPTSFPDSEDRFRVECARRAKFAVKW